MAGRGLGGPAAVLLLVALLVLVQVVVAAHQVEHLAVPESEHDCPLCLTGQSLDQAGAPALGVPALLVAGPVALPPAVALAHPRPSAPYQGRAPPPSLVAV
ncbi:MAG: hypothetical protein MUC77_07830 [Chromatiaceae bacterium]|nr:hypothetical protein [Chromatiaceae bacterium]